MTPRMRDALTEARRGPLRRVFDDKPGRPLWPAPAVTLHALVRHGLLELSERRTRKGWKLQEWRITDAGREALVVRIVMRDTVRRLRVPGGSTRLMQGGVWVDALMPEPEQMDPGEGWAREAARRHAEADDPRERARRLARNLRRAA